jgi:hypothetical protein
MTEHQTSRTLVKSAPELWAECSDAASLARHLGAFGEIRITKLEPETTVAWEGAAVSGTVKLEPSGWGTRVTLTMSEEEAAVAEQAAVVKQAAVVELAVVEPSPSEPDPEPAVEEPVAVQEPEIDELPPRVGWLGRLRLRLGGRPTELVEPAGEAPEPASEPAPGEPAEVTAEQPPEVVAEADPPSDPDPTSDANPTSEPEATGEPGESAGAEALAAALDSLGRAHHRPYSRA